MSFDPASIPKVLSTFPHLKLGKIHLICPRCGKRNANVDRDETEPKRASFCIMTCPACTPRGHENEMLDDSDYLDSEGNKISMVEL